jgi:DNA-binding NarL/FixJ family response regulator
VRILVADDDAHVRSALRLLLEQEADMEIVGEARTVDELLAQLTETPACVVLIDWELPGLRRNGSAVSSLRAAMHGTRLIALSGRPEAHVEAQRAGVDGFVCKGDSPETLVATLRSLCGSGAPQQ